MERTLTKTVPYLIQRGKKYSFRRRTTWKNTDNHPISISLGTSDFDKAQFVARKIAYKWDLLVMELSKSHLSGSEIIKLFKSEMNREVGRATEDWFKLSPRRIDEPHKEQWAHANAYEKFSASIFWDIDQLDPIDEPSILKNEKPSRIGMHPVKFADAVNSGKLGKKLDESDVVEALIAAGIKGKGNIQNVMRIIYEARATARWKIARVLEGLDTYPDLVALLELIMSDAPVSAPVPVASSIKTPNDEMDKSAPPPVPTVTVQTLPANEPDFGNESNPISVPDIPVFKHSVEAPSPQQNADCPYLERVETTFLDSIEGILEKLKTGGNWSGNLEQERRIMRSFAWIVGNKPLHAYRPSDVARFVSALDRVPTDFVWGKGMGKAGEPFPMSFEDALAEHLSKPQSERGKGAKAERSARTFNRDLRIMGRAADMLFKNEWRPKSTAKVMDFSMDIRRVDDKSSSIGDDVDRMPWGVDDLKAMFNLPLFTGGAGYLNRMRVPARPIVYQDAAFWAVLIAAYTGARRGEICGLELADIFLDEAIPFIRIIENTIRPTLKTKHARRLIPLHSELLRLGLADYVLKVKKEGNGLALFPELFPADKVQTGALVFSKKAWPHIVKSLAVDRALPVTSADKTADFHSMRTYFYSAISVNLLMTEPTTEIPDKPSDWRIADIIGHARQGVGPKKYFRPEATLGHDPYLRHLKDAIEKAPIVTSGLTKQPVRMLPLDKRSAVGNWYYGKRRRVTNA